MFGINLSIVLLVTSVVAICSGNRLPDTPQTHSDALTGISHPDSDIMAVVEQLKVKIMSMEEHYDDTVKEIKKHYDGEILELNKYYDGEILELKNTQTSHEATIKELKERHDEMQLIHDAEILALKESYNVMISKNKGLEIKYAQLAKGYVSEANSEEIDARIKQTDNEVARVDKNRNKSDLKADPQTEITSPQKKSDVSVANGRNNKENPAQTADSKSDQLKQPLEMSGHNALDLNAGEGQAVGFSAFQVYMSADYIGDPDDILMYDDVRINIGGVYDAALGTFTAPTAGLYVINRSQLADNSCGTGPAYISLRVNGVHISYTSSEYKTSTAKTELLQLVAGDEVWLQTYSSGCHSFIGGNYNSFSGYLLVENI